MEGKSKKSAGFPADFSLIKGKTKVRGGNCRISQRMKHGKGNISAGAPEITAFIIQSLQDAGCSGVVTQKFRDSQNTFFAICGKEKTLT